MVDSGRVLKVWVLSDGRPGHFHQSSGIVEALKLLYPVKTEWINIRLRVGFLRRVLRFLINKIDRPLPWMILTLCYRLPDLPLDVPDVIVSAGGKTSFLNAEFAKHYKCRNLFAGSLRGLSDRNFTAVLTIEPIADSNNNIVLDLAPTIIDLEEVKKEGEVFLQQKDLIDQRLWTMIIGGEGAGYKYKKSDWDVLTKAMVALAARFQIKWLLTTSPRTGSQVESLLQETIEKNILADCVWYASKPQKIMKAYLGAAELVYCTEDSMTMITEAVASGKPLISLSPLSSSPEARYSSALDRLAVKGWLSRINISELQIIDISTLKRGFTPLESTASALLADKLECVLADNKDQHENN